MKNFFKPNSLKIKITIGLIVYILLGLMFIASFNTTRSKKQVEINSIQRVGIIISFPAVYLSMPYIYVIDKLSTQEMTLGKVLNGDVDGEENKILALDPPITRVTFVGLFAGILVEILFLYTLGCIISSIFNHKRKKIRLNTHL